MYANTTIRKLLFSYQKVKSITLPLIHDKEESVGGTIKWATMQVNAFAPVIISVENAAISVILNNAARLNRTRPIFWRFPRKTQTCREGRKPTESA